MKWNDAMARLTDVVGGRPKYFPRVPAVAVGTRWSFPSPNNCAGGPQGRQNPVKLNDQGQPPRPLGGDLEQRDGVDRAVKSRWTDLDWLGRYVVRWRNL